MKRSLPCYLLFSAAVAMALSAARAAVKPNPLFSDNAVLQQGVEVPVWGIAKDGETVSVKIAGQTASTIAKEGKWSVRLKGLKAGGPFVMTVKGDNTVTIQNVFVGEVWVCSGQSNMERQLGPRPPQQPIYNWEQERAEANYPQIRHFGVAQKASDQPLTEVSGSWTVCSPETAQNFTAVGYFFGRDLHKAIKAPVGLIHSSVGGTPAEAWTRRDALEQVSELQTDILAKAAKAAVDYPALLAKYKEDEPKLLAKFEADTVKAKAEGKPLPRKPGPPASPSTNRSRPCGLYNAMIAPLLPYAIRGVIWYQGESNAGHPKQYRTLFPAMIANWREAWGEGEFPFLFVQIAPNRGQGPEIREAQLLTSQRTPNTAMAVLTDCGDANDIHPTHKQPVGARLALAARALAYHKPIEYSGPVFQAMKVEGAVAILSFTHLGGGLVAKDGALKGFTIAGEDKKFVDAKAELRGETVVMTGTSVAKPVAVRFGWTNVPDGNLFNKAGLPASPFRTDVD